MSKKILIIPTYNERYNVPIIYRKIRKYNKNLEVLFIDDNSPDGTIDVIRNIQKKDNKVKVLFRKKKVELDLLTKRQYLGLQKENINYASQWMLI